MILLNRRQWLIEIDVLLRENDGSNEICMRAGALTLQTEMREDRQMIVTSDVNAFMNKFWGNLQEHFDVSSVNVILDTK